METSPRVNHLEERRLHLMRLIEAMHDLALSPCQQQIRDSAPSRQHSFNVTLRVLLCCPDLDDLEAGGLQQCTPLLLCALHGYEYGHHVDVDMSHKGTGSSTRNDKLVDKEFGVSLLHGFAGVTQNHTALVVRPVMVDVVEVVNACT